MCSITSCKITSLKHNEVFVSGSNEGGRHGSLDKVKIYVNRFLPIVKANPLVKANPQLHFLITDVGCGLAGFKHADIAPMFKRNHIS